MGEYSEVQAMFAAEDHGVDLTDRSLDDMSPQTFEQMTDGPLETGLCDFCPLPEEIRGTHLTPSGPIMCEGSHCKDAYEMYEEDFLEKMFDRRVEDGTDIH